jgi:hypothetical protein
MVKNREWSDEEIMRLRKLYPSNKTFDEIVEYFPHRTENAIRLKASRLNIRRPYIGVTRLKSIKIKINNGRDSTNYLIKCKECGSWMQINEKSQSELNFSSCKKCGTGNHLLSI